MCLFQGQSDDFWIETAVVTVADTVFTYKANISKASFTKKPTPIRLCPILDILLNMSLAQYDVRIQSIPYD